MREIKFRVWNKSEKYMYMPTFTEEGAFIEGMKGYPGMIRRREIISVQRIFNDPELTVMQYTGLKDKNGKEIWEGDIVLMPHTLVGDPEYGDFKHPQVLCWRGIVCYYPERAEFRVDCHNTFNLYEKDSIEVIGNIYENPELLKETAS